MARLKCWRVSSSDKNWWFIPKKRPTPTSPTEKTLNIVKWKRSGKYHIYKQVGLKRPTLIKRTDNIQSARRLAKSYMKKHDVCEI